MKTVYTFIPSPNHVYPDHPERPGRLELLQPRLESFDAKSIETTSATREEIAYVHNPKLVSALERVCREEAPGIIDYAPTYVTPSSFEDALLAAGGVMTCARAVLNGEAKNAFAIVRPPGHHAEPARAMGFCIFNNIAIAARDLLERGAGRVLVVDYDAHHGNGTQAAFWKDERLAYLSTHQWGIYPGSGGMDDAPHAKGRIVNVPLPAYAGDACFAQISEQIIAPMVQSFRPDMMLVSAGFDAHWDDPITMLGLSSAGFFAISNRLVELAGEFCNGKIAFVLEGGYSPRNVMNGASAVFAALTGKPFADAGDAYRGAQPDITKMIESIRAWNGFV
jgi:acetoin utilization deacetylase AcuC-like enzyme